MNIDDALIAYRADLITAAHLWQQRRARRNRRLALVTTALTVAGLIVGGAIAATGWLVGSPAPPNVKSDFGSYATQLGFNPEPGKAVLVASHGAYKLYVTPDKQGGYCTLISDPWNHPGPHGEGGDCNSWQQASVAFWAGPVGAGALGLAPHRTTLVVAGRTRNKAAKRVRFTTPAHKNVTTALGTSGFFIVPVTVHPPKVSPSLSNGIVPGSCRWTSTFVLLDAKARELSRTTLSFGPRICLRPPKPTITKQNGTTIFTLTPGQNGYLAKAHPGDQIACQAVGHALTLVVPQGAQGRYRRTPDRHHSLNVRHTRDGRIWVLCQ